MKHKETNSYTIQSILSITIQSVINVNHTIGHNLNLIMKYSCFRINACAHEK